MPNVTQYFEYHYAGPAFELFGTGHLFAMAIIAAVFAYLIWGWRTPDEDSKRRARLSILVIMFLNEVGWHAWNIYNGGWSVREHLPLHVCSLSIWGSMYVLLTRDYRVYEVVFFIGVVGAIQALVTPSAGIYGLPHYRAFQTLISHSMIIIAKIYMTRVEGFRPRWSSLWRTMLIINGVVGLVTVINVALDSNYMYTLQKPDTASLFDIMGPWPWYLFWAEFLALFLFTLLYLPFAIADRRRAYASL